jgi:hypothetical protein
VKHLRVLVALAMFAGVQVSVNASSVAAAPTFHCPANPAPTPRTLLPRRARALGNGDPLIGRGDLWTTRLNAVGYALDGTWGTKQPWFRVVPGTLTITGRRLDGPGQFSADVPPASSYARTGFIPSRLRFSSGGCWEVTAGLGRTRVVLHVSIDGSNAAICRELSTSLRVLEVQNFAPNDALEARERSEFDRRRCNG